MRLVLHPLSPAHARAFRTRPIALALALGSTLWGASTAPPAESAPPRDRASGAPPPEAAWQRHPLAPDWRDVSILEIITDRIFDGAPANNNAQGSYAPSAGRGVHGGDWEGLRQKLDYLSGLGVGAVTISPVALTAHGDYDGAGPRDLSTYSPVMGGLSELQNFIAAAHAYGLYVVLDITAEHLADLIDSVSPGYPAYNAAGSYTLRWRDPGLRYAPPFDNLGLFHANGVTGNYTDPEQLLGELTGLDDLRTESAVVRDALVNAYGQMILQTDCDGFRIDAVRFADLSFWQDFCARIRAAAAANSGKTNFLLLGDVAETDPAKLGSYTGTVAGGTYVMDSVSWVPMTAAARGLFSGTGSPASVAAVYADSGAYDPTVRRQLANAIDGAALGRLGGAGVADHDDALMRVALTWLLTSPGLPILYYGTEQEYDGSTVPENQEDLFDGQWQSGASAGDGFHMAAPLYQHVAALNALRLKIPALRRGTIAVLRADAGGPGMLAYLRGHSAGDVLVALNTAMSGLHADLSPTPWPAGTVLQDLLMPGRSVAVAAGGVVSVDIPARSALVLAASTVVVPVTVSATWPAHSGVLTLPEHGAEIVFDRPMPAAASAAVSFEPPVAASYVWRDSRTLIVQPRDGWLDHATYKLRVAAFTLAQDGTALQEIFSFRFSTDFGGIGLELPPGFLAEARSPQGMFQPVALAVAPSGWVGNAPAVELPLVSDAQRLRVLRVQPGPKVATFAVIGAGAPLGMELDDSGQLWLATPTQLLRCDRFGGLVPRATAPTPWHALWVGTGAHAGRIYLASPAAHGLYKIAGISTALFAPGIANPHGVAQPLPTSGWPDLLLVCDPDLGASRGSGTIQQVDLAGAHSDWLSDPAVAGVTALAFAPDGAFALGNLYALDARDERILRIDATGHLSVFASGFHNLAGAATLSFSASGDLYVVDAGGSEQATNTFGSSAAPRLVRIVGDARVAAPALPRARVALDPPVPNPFNPHTELRFHLSEAASVQMEIIDAAGRRVALLIDGQLPAGDHQAAWDGRDHAGHAAGSGVYFVRLKLADAELCRKLTLVR